RLACAQSRQFDGHLSALRSDKLVGNLLGVPGLGRFPVDLDDLIAVAYTAAMSRSRVERRHYINLVVPLRDGRAYTRVLAALVLLDLLPLFLIEIVGVRVERVQHAKDRGLCSLV